MAENTITKINIIGMGALGLLYADQLTKGLGKEVDVTFVMDRDRAERHKKDVYTINGEEKHFNIVSEDEAEVADMVIVAVKYTALAEALDTMKTSVGDDTVIVSVLNGVTSEQIIAKRYGMDKLIYSVAMGMDAMRDGTTLKYTQCGKLRIGATDDKMKERLHKVEVLFIKGNVPYVAEEDILYRMWFKFMLNIGINQACMVYDTNYGYATTEGNECNEKMIGAMKEVLEIAAKKGISLTMDDLNQCIEIIKTLDPVGYPSMAQDRKAKRKSEVDMFAGEMLRMGKEFGVEVPYNQFFYDRVMEIEALY